MLLAKSSDFTALSSCIISNQFAPYVAMAYLYRCSSQRRLGPGRAWAGCPSLAPFRFLLSCHQPRDLYETILLKKMHLEPPRNILKQNANPDIIMAQPPRHAITLIGPMFLTFYHCIGYMLIGWVFSVTITPSPSLPPPLGDPPWGFPRGIPPGGSPRGASLTHQAHKTAIHDHALSDSVLLSG
jgi:hypothetical protein